MKRAGTFILERPAIVISTIVSAAIIVGQLGIWLLKNKLANDFSVYWRTANGPLSAVYSPEFTFPFSSAPTMLIWISPLSAVPLWPAFIMWSIISVASIVWVCSKYLKREELWLLLASPPMAIGLFTGQVSIILAAMMLWSFGTENRLRAGIALGIIATIKPQLVLFAPLLLLLRADWRALTGAAATFALLLALSVILFGLQIWPEWLASMESFRAFLHREIMGDAMAPAAAAEGWGLPAWPFLLGGIIAGAWLIFWCRKAGPLESAAAVGTASLLGAPYGMNYDLAAVAPFLVCSIFRGRIVSALAISAVAPPIPLVLAGYELAKFGHRPGRDQLERRSSPVG